MSTRTRYLAAGLLVVASVGGPFGFTPLASEGSADVGAEAVVTLQDERIDESSGLVVRDRRLFTVNDSGDGPYVYEVSLETGKTVGVTTYAAEDPEDVEALASGPGGTLWVGDIGDNRSARSSVRLYRLRPDAGGGTVDAATFDLAYPGRPHDAEALLVHPRTGRVLVVTKRFLRGGVVFRAPRRLVPGQTHELERVATVPGMITGGTFLRGGGRLLLRSYGSAALYTYPAFAKVADAPLPRQEQGEAVAVEDGRVYLSSEGEHSDILVTDLPQPSGRSTEAAEEPTRADTARPNPGPGRPTEYDPEPWLGLGLGRFLLVAFGSGIGVLLLRAALRRARHRP